ncbi:hypothetical protein SAMN04487962_10418 [Marinobacter segnicrescens]|uniref:Uncharacterized protein n=1 Tax=Marinobacter segnicrescens TaxID=430453 RepID=A0A1I0BJ42_9GAMM|nr:hypothetical protein SAMN04487962_10418 [Marinobacter segnicrescens]
MPMAKFVDHSLVLTNVQNDAAAQIDDVGNWINRTMLPFVKRVDHTFGHLGQARGRDFRVSILLAGGHDFPAAQALGVKRQDLVVNLVRRVCLMKMD